MEASIIDFGLHEFEVGINVVRWKMKNINYGIYQLYTPGYLRLQKVGVRI